MTNTRLPRTLIAGLSLLFPLLASACSLGLDGDGKRTSQVRDARDFTQVENDASLDVKIEQGAAFSVVVSIDSNLQREVTTRVVGDKLMIGVDHAIGDTVGGPHVLVTMPVLGAASLDGSGDLTAGAFRQDLGVELELAGSGVLAWSGAVPSISARLSGSGELRIDGSATAVDLSLDGSGNLDARNCPAASGQLSLSGSGNVAATIAGPARVSLSGSGNIDLFGGTTIESASSSGSGTIRIHQE